MAQPLKIIIFDGSFKTTAFINRLAKGFAVDHQVYILGFNENVSKKLRNVNYVPLGSNQNVLRFIITSLRYAMQAASAFFPTIIHLIKGDRQKLQQQNLRFALDKIKPDIIHLQWPSVLPWFEEELKMQNIPVILSQRGFHINVRPFVDKENFAYLQTWYPKIAGFHSVSKAIAANGHKIWNAPEKIDKVVYTGLPLKEFPFSETYNRSEPLQLLSVGRTHWKKGYDYALQSCKILKDKNISFQYTIIGGAGEEELQFLVSDLGLEDCVNLVGRLSQVEVYGRMREASLLLMPSVEEGLPNVVVEAMALGLPVLSTNCGGVPELIEDGVDGWIVPIRNPEAMAEAVVAFYELPLEKIEDVRVAARKKVETQHNEERMIREMEALYRAVLERFLAEDAESNAEYTE
ncbi:glycosyltransferase family 4 protein [Gelidibacter japonicus]|uniref:glycosyltransferase family 4 protein n=1 Tax=Gelidibacter japonicus TaxID=1962232 RepID=UPI003A8FE4FA